MDVLSAFQAELDAAWRATPPHLRVTSESESGLGTGRALAALIDQLSRQAGDPLSTADQQHTFAVALRQVDAHGRPVDPRRLNKPDISYLGDAAGTSRRVNIEIETQNLNRHVAQVNRDPHAHNVFLKIDPWTGAILGGLERQPGTTSVRPLTADQAQAIVAQLPRPQRDPTLVVHPRTGAQIRRTPRAANPRPTAAPRTARPVARTRVPRTRESEWESGPDRGVSGLDV